MFEAKPKRNTHEEKPRGKETSAGDTQGAVTVA